jgi:opacity protein-like surface antigen
MDGIRSNRVLLLLATGVLAVTALQDASAEDDYSGWTGRAWAGVVCRCVEDDNVTFQDATFGTVELDVDGNGIGYGFDVERRINKLIGLDFALGYTDLDVDFNHSVGTGVQQDSLGALIMWFAVNFHLVNKPKFDFWVAPQIAYVNWTDDLSFDVPGTGTFNFPTDNEFPALGLAMGADWWVSKDWAVNFAFRFIDADADSGHTLPVDPTFITIGVARKF